MKPLEGLTINMATRLGKLLLLLGLGAGIALAASPLGSVSVTGSVELGDAQLSAPAVPSWPVSSGDRIATGDDGFARIATQEGRVEVRNNSRATLYGDRIELEQGAVGVERLPVRLGDWTVESRSGAAGWFVVANREGKALVAAHRGDVVVRRPGSAPIVVPAGAFAMPPAPRVEDPDEEEDRRRNKGAIGAGGSKGAGSSSGWTIGSLSHGQSVALVGALGAAATAGTVAAVTLGDDEPARSPSN